MFFHTYKSIHPLNIPKNRYVEKPENIFLYSEINISLAGNLTVGDVE